MVLNEVDKEMESVIPKTDCRLRPDIRAMENGEIGEKTASSLWYSGSYPPRELSVQIQHLWL